MKFHQTTAIIQLPPILSHLQLPLFCRLCLFHQQPPPQQRFGDKIRDVKERCPSHAQSFRFPFTPPPSPLPTIQLGTTKTQGWLCGLLHRGAYYLFLCPQTSRSAGSRVTHSFTIYCSPALHQALCETHASKSWQTKEKSGREHRQLQSSVCAREGPGPTRTLRAWGMPWSLGLHICTLNSSTSWSRPDCWECLGTESSILVK